VVTAVAGPSWEQDERDAREEQLLDDALDRLLAPVGCPHADTDQCTDMTPCEGCPVRQRTGRPWWRW
jgi:hypothetical protein